MRCSLLAASLLAVLPVARGQAPAQDERAPAHLALLIGIDRYSPDSGLPALGGCKNDVQRAREILVGRFGFDPSEVQVLVDEQATFEGIVGAFDRWLLRSAGPETEVVLWFSGHGSRVPDRSGVSEAEPGRLDSSLLAYDSRAVGRRGEYDLSDDALRSLLAALCRRSSRVLVVTDSCHSGGATRGARPVGVRSVGQGSRPLDRTLVARFWPADAPLSEDAALELPGLGHAHVSACGASELAQEVELAAEGGQGRRRHGALSWYLGLALEESRPGMSIRRVAQDAAVRLALEVPGQTVWCEGAVERELFGAGFEERPPGYPARVRAAGSLVVQAGAAHALRVGSRFEVYDNSERTVIAHARATDVTALQSLAALEEQGLGDLEARILRVREVSRPEGIEPLRVCPQPEELARRLSGLEGAVLAPAEQAELFLEREADGGLTLSTREGLRLIALDERSAAASDEAGERRALAEALARELRFRALFALARQPGDWPLEVRLERATASELEALRAQWKDFGKDLPLIAGAIEPLAPERGSAACSAWEIVAPLDAGAHLCMLEVTNPHDRPLHLAVLSVAEDRSRNRIWPTDGRRDNRIEARGTRRVPFLALSHSRWSLERAMRDRYLAIATEEHADFSSLQQAAQLRGGEDQALPGVLREALQARPLRGGSARDVRTAGWGVGFADLLVLPR